MDNFCYKESKINKTIGENFGYHLYKYTSLRDFHFDKYSKIVYVENFYNDIQGLKNKKGQFLQMTLYILRNMHCQMNSNKD